MFLQNQCDTSAITASLMKVPEGWDCANVKLLYVQMYSTHLACYTQQLDSCSHVILAVHVQHR